MKREEIANFLLRNVEPLKNNIYGDEYRAAVHLEDGTYLPCVLFQNRRIATEQAVHTFKRLRWRPAKYRDSIELIVLGGSRVSQYDLKDVEISPFAWPIGLLKQIHGETAMGWTAFVVEMRDKTLHSYGTAFSMNFFDLPEGYSHADIASIRSGMVYSKRRGLVEYFSGATSEIQHVREKPFFTCYLDGLKSA